MEKKQLKLATCSSLESFQSLDDLRNALNIILAGSEEELSALQDSVRSMRQRRARWEARIDAADEAEVERLAAEWRGPESAE